MSTPAKKRRVRRVAASLLARLKRLSLRRLLHAIVWLFERVRQPRVLLQAARTNVQKLQRRTKRRVILIAVVILAGVPLTLTGLSAISYQSPQVSYYNQAMVIYDQGWVSSDYQYITFNSIALFESSITAYQNECHESRLAQWLHGAPSTELEALAEFHLGLAYLEVAEGTGENSVYEQAIATLKTAITMNPGLPYAKDIAAGDVTRLAEESLPPKYDLELLFSQNPQLEKEQAKPGNGQPKVGKSSNSSQMQQSPSQNPQNVPGHGSSNGI